MPPGTSTPLLPARTGTLRTAATALRAWTPARWSVSAISAVGVALAIGIPTVLIPNPVFGREIPVVWWNYPVWILTSLLAGMLVATYVRPRRRQSANRPEGRPADPSEDEPADQPEGPSRAGLAGGVLMWFAVGCPVCNKIALLALGYTGALTWFAPFQPVLAVAGLALTAGALVVRLRGEVYCAVPAPAVAPASSEHA